MDLAIEILNYVTIFVCGGVAGFALCLWKIQD